MKITADTILFFDLDGTLVDTNLANFLAYKQAILTVTNSDYGLTFNPDKRFNRNNLKNAVPNLSENELERIITAKEQYYNNFLPETNLIKPIADFLFKFSKTNKTVMVTNCRQDRAIETLNYHGLTDKFTKIFCREFSPNGEKINKFQTAITVLGVPPNTVVAFENEETEISDAIKAGIVIINPEIA